MIYDYRDKEGYVSLWIGKCSNYSTIDTYLSTVYIDEEVEPDKILKNIFIPANKDRPCEEELKNAFDDEFYNQFEYDFALTFDEDFREAYVHTEYTSNLEELFDGFSYYETFADETRTLANTQLPKCNTALALYDFKYCGGILESKHENISMYFLGCVRYSKK